MTKATEHGGKLRQGQRKLKRPLEVGKATNIILDSSAAKGCLSFKTNRALVEEIVRERASISSIEIDKIETTATRIHLVVRFEKRENVQKFMRTLTGLLARRITGAEKGRPFGRKFWDHTPLTSLAE